MRKRLITLTGALLIGGASSLALAVPASAAPLSAASFTAVSSAAFVSPLVRFADTSTSTTTGSILATFGSVYLASVSL